MPSWTGDSGYRSSIAAFTACWTALSTTLLVIPFLTARDTNSQLRSWSALRNDGQTAHSLVVVTVGNVGSADSKTPDIDPVMSKTIGIPLHASTLSLEGSD